MANWQSIDELHDISADLPRFTQAFTELATRLGLDIAPLEADHISLRCHQNATAERWRRGFEQCGELLPRTSLTVAPSACSNCMSR
jgi:predicted metalloenzyme YecM